ncbi:MAG TPA: aldehyde dehydrogenase family protein [Pseudonocardiaceae bacterium]
MSEPTIEAEPRQCWIAGVGERGERSLTVRHPFDDTDVADVTVPGSAQIERAVAGAAAIAGEFRNSPAAERARSLYQAADLLVRRGEEIAETITAESGKPWRWAEVEVTLAVRVFRAAAAAAAEFNGELGATNKPARTATTDVPMRLVGTRRRARGPVLAIGSSTFPLAGAARQIAPALAVGAPVVSKPASLTPLSTLLLGEILAEADLPAGVFSVLPLRGSNITDLVLDPRLPVISMVGSRASGAAVRTAAPDKHFVLELGGTTTAIVCPDLTDLTGVAEQIALAANAQAGQARLALRRVLVHRDVAEAFQAKLLSAVRALATGSPHDPEVTVGPLVSEEAAILATRWVNDTIAGGAKLLTGGVRDRATMTPTVLAAPPEFHCEETLAPALLLSTVDSTRSALAAANATGSGLPVGVLTHDMRTALLAANELDADVLVGALPADAATIDDIADVVEAYTRPQTVVLNGGSMD